jgi:glycosyltransferase involved in cell wall biosynthesis
VREDWNNLPVSNVRGCPLKLSLCITIRNEQESFASLIESLLAQSRPPEEIIAVDGGSTDGTVELLHAYAARQGRLRVIALDEANIAEGRNIAIANARHSYIASADGGVEYPKSWLENLVRPLERNPHVDVVCGYFEAKPETFFEECVGAVLYPTRNLVDWNRFLPSCRSVAFKRKVWEDLGGYAEWLPRGISEDTHFFIRARKAGYNFTYAPDATCYWRPRRNFSEVFKQYFYYTRGAFISGSGSTFMSEAFGANPVKFTAKNLAYLIQKRKMLHFFLSVLILAVVFLAKVTGCIAGVTQRRRASSQNQSM